MGICATAFKVSGLEASALFFPFCAALCGLGNGRAACSFPALPRSFPCFRKAGGNIGEITVDVLNPVGCVALDSDGHNSLAMLVRRKGETLAQLLIRLDLAIAKEYTENVFTGEINSPPTNTQRR